MENAVACIVVLEEDKRTVRIRDLWIESQELHDALSSLNEQGRYDYLRKTLLVGVQVRGMMDTTSRVDYVTSEFESMKRKFAEEFDKVFSNKGCLPTMLDQFLGERGELSARASGDGHKII